MKKQEIRLADNLQAYLNKRCLTQSQLSREVGMRTSTLHSYLCGTIPSGLESTIKLANCLNLDLDELVFGIKPSPRKES